MPGLAVEVAADMETLLERLAVRLSRPLADPFTPEIVAVPNLGVRQWVTRGLASRLGRSASADGIVSNIEFPFFETLMVRITGKPVDDPWQLDRLVWAVQTVLMRDAGDPALGPPARAVVDAAVPEPSAGSWFGRARHLADTFDRYSRHRPELLLHWHAGRDTTASGDPIPIADRWQCELWRRVRALVDEPSPSERLVERFGRPDAEGSATDLGLPPRLTFFGLSVLPNLWARVLPSLSTSLDVAVLWHANAPGVFGVEPPGSGAGASAPTTGGPLPSWSAPGLVAARGLITDVPGAHVTRVEETSAAHEPSTTLQRLHDAVRASRSIEAGPGDRSLQIHRCAGIARQVDVARTAILHAFEDLADLRPDDVLVLTPDVDTVAPLVEAAFGEDRSDGPPAIPVDVSTRSPGADHATAKAVLDVLSFADGRGAAGEVLTWLGLDPVARRAGLSAIDLERIAQWVEDADIRWGLDGSHRRVFGVPERYDVATWRQGIDRLLLGSAARQVSLGLTIGDLDAVGVEGGDMTTLARLARVHGELCRVVGPFHVAPDRPSPRRSLRSWTEWAREVLDTLTEPVPADDWERRHLSAVLDEMESVGAELDPALTPMEFRSALSEALGRTRRRGGSPEGSLRFGHLAALRSVPARVICLVGMDTESLTTADVDGDDLLTLDPAPNDPDRRLERRAQLLDALMAAGERLIITSTGRHPSTNAEVPLPVVLHELVEACGAPERDVVVDSPRRANDPANFRGGERTLRSFDRVALGEAMAIEGPRTPRGPYVDPPLRSLDRGDIAVDELRRFLANPARSFLRDRLGVSLPGPPEPPSALQPIELDPLQAYRLKDELLAEARREGGLEEVRAAWSSKVQHDGRIAPGPAGTEAIAALVDQVHAIECACPGGRFPAGGRSMNVSISLPDAGHVRGRVSDLDDSTTSLVRIGVQQLYAHHVIADWLDLIVLGAHSPNRPWRSLRVATNNKKATVVTSRLRGATPDERSNRSTDALIAIVDLYRRNGSEPLPMMPNAAARALGDDAIATLGLVPVRTKAWSGNGMGEADNPEATEVWQGAGEGPYLDLRASDDDPGPSECDRRVIRLAHALFDAIANAVETADDDRTDADG